MRLPRYYYVISSMVLLVIEILIERFVNDRFIRPYVGDFLVVILLYTLVMSLSSKKAIPVALGVLAFSYLIETAQYFKLIYLLNLSDMPWARAVIGTSFSWWDMLMYTAGVISLILVESAFKSCKLTQ